MRATKSLAMLLDCCYTVAMERNEQIVSTNTRYPKELHDALQQLARDHKRSFNGEVMWALQRYVSQEKTEPRELNEAHPSWRGEGKN